MSREDPQLKLRLPSPLKQLIENSANGAGRSMNAEIVARLQETFGERDPSGHVSVVLSSLESSLATSAIERWHLKSELHNMGHAVQMLVHAMREGNPLDAKDAEKLLEFAQNACQGVAHEEDPLLDIQNALDDASKKVKEAAQQLVAGTRLFRNQTSDGQIKK